MRPIVAITGRAGHGKDSLYRLVLAPRGYYRVALADPVKALYLQRLAAEDASPLAAAERYYHAFGATKTPEARRALQQIGTEQVREGLDPFYWVWLALQEIKRLVQSGEKVAITDCRFPNEAAALRGEAQTIRRMYEELAASGKAFSERIQRDLLTPWEVGGLLPPSGIALVVRVVKPGRTLEGEAGQHASEQGVEEIRPDVILEANNLLELREMGQRLLVEDRPPDRGWQTRAGWARAIELRGGPLHNTSAFAPDDVREIALPPGEGAWLYRRDPDQPGVFVFAGDA